jgi:hypothetical protein
MLPSLIGLTTEKAPAPNARKRLCSLLAASGKINVLRTAAHRTLMGAGVCAIGAMGVMFVRPEMTDHIKAMSPFAARTTQQAAVAVPAPSMTVVAAAKPVPVKPAVPEASHTEVVASQANQIEHATKLPVADQKDPAQREQKWVTNWLSKRYRVAGDATNMLVSATYNRRGK